MSRQWPHYHTIILSLWVLFDKTNLYTRVTKVNLHILLGGDAAMRATMPIFVNVYFRTHQMCSSVEEAIILLFRTKWAAAINHVGVSIYTYRITNGDEIYSVNVEAPCSLPNKLTASLSLLLYTKTLDYIYWYRVGESRVHCSIISSDLFKI